MIKRGRSPTLLVPVEEPHLRDHRSFPVNTFRRVPNTWIEPIGGVKAFVMVFQRLFGEIQMTDVMLSRILSTPRVEYFPHGVLYSHCVEPLLHDVVLVKYLAKEVAVIECVLDLRGKTLRQMLAPSGAVSRQSNIKRDDVLNFLPMDRAVTNCGTGSGKPMQEGFRAFFGSAFEIGPFGRRKNGVQIGAGFFDYVIGHPEHKMMLE